MKRRLLFITIAFSVSFVLVAALSVTSITRFSLLAASTEDVERSYRSLDLISLLETNVRNVDRYERGYLLTHDSSFLRYIDPVKKTFDSAVLELRELSGSREDVQNRLSVLRADMRDRYRTALDNILRTDADSLRRMRKSDFYAGREAMQRCVATLTLLRNAEDAVLQQRNRQRKEVREVASITIRTLSLVFGVLTLVLFALMLREFRRRLRFSDQLQLKMTELQHTHNELEQIAFATSHDLQEPLRKIRIFIDRLLYLRRNGNREDSTDTLERISAATNRMQDLVGDLGALTSLVNVEESSREVSLQAIVTEVEKALAARIISHGAIIHTSPLPRLPGYPGQLRLLFTALLDNSLKFSRPGLPPEIDVSCELATADELRELDERLVGSPGKYYCVSVSDNGIGFDNKLAEKMFGIFRQLHNRQAGYEGRGIGLAISQRVMSNHKGYIRAHGHSSGGATFKLYFPV